MNTLVIGNIQLSLPSKLDELSKKQLRKIYAIQDVELESWQFNQFLFRVLIGKNLKLWFFLAYNSYLIPVFDFLTFRLFVWKQKYISVDDWHDCAELYTEFLGDRKQNLTKNPFKLVRHKWSWLRGPQDKFANVSYGEFIKADEFFLVYQATKKVEYLEKMIAVLWRPYLWKRAKFSIEKLSRHVHIIQKLSTTDKELILLWYVGCRKILEGEFRNIFSGEGEGTLQLKHIQQYAKSMGKKVFDYAQTPADADIERIYYANVYSVLRKIDQEIGQYKKLTDGNS